MIQRAVIITFLILLLTAPVATAKIYYWIDENGVKHFSSEPPPAGTPVIEKNEEIPYDEQEAEKYRREQEQTWQKLQQMWEEQRRQESAEAAEAQRRQEAEQRRIEAEKQRQEEEQQAIREKRYEKGTYEQKRRRRERAAEQQGQTQ